MRLGGCHFNSLVFAPPNAQNKALSAAAAAAAAADAAVVGLLGCRPQLSCQLQASFLQACHLAVASWQRRCRQLSKRPPTPGGWATACPQHGPWLVHALRQLQGS